MSLGRDRLIPAREVEGLIADGHLVVVYEGLALKLDNWLQKHPGGHLAIEHMVGKDATDEIDAYHCDQTLRRMKAFRIGRVQLPWTNFVPPIQGGVYRRLGEANDNGEASEMDLDPTADETTDDSAEESSLFSAQRDTLSSASIDDGDEIELESKPEPETTALPSSTCRLRAKPSTAPTSAPTKHSTSALPAERLSREAYVAAMEQSEIADNIRSYPSLDQATQDAIRAEYRALHQIIKDEGLYVCRYSEYGKECVRYAMIFGAFLYFLRLEWYVLSAICLGLFWQQVMFVAHDAGHRGITGNFIVDTVIGAFVGDFCNGLSIGWWKSSHNVHHLVTNMPEHDPDNQNVPIFATSPTYFKSIFSSFYKFRFVWDAVADTLVPWQKYTYYPVMCVARFNLYLLSWTHLLLSPRASQLGSAWWTRYLELVFMAGFWSLFGYALLWRTLPDWPTRVIFVLVSHAVTMVLHVQITLSHWGMPHSDLGPTESFAQRQLRTTMDVACPPWLDFVHGGLQFQAVHHLFPRVPRHNLRKCQELVREFCEKTRIEYQCLGFVDGNKVMLTRLQEVGRMVETLVQCSTHMAETGHYELE